MLGLSLRLGQLHLATQGAGEATRCWDITLPGKTGSLIPNENCSDDAMVTTSYSAELLGSFSNINCLALRF